MARYLTQANDPATVWCSCGKQHKYGYTHEKINGKYTRWWVCANCLRPAIRTLNQCDTCDGLFKGIGPHIKIAYTCPKCEMM